MWKVDFFERSLWEGENSVHPLGFMGLWGGFFSLVIPKSLDGDKVTRQLKAFLVALPQKGAQWTTDSSEPFDNSRAFSTF